MTTINPAAGPVASRFGMRWHPIHKKNLMHYGTDIADPPDGSKVRIHAPQAGTLTVVNRRAHPTAGKYVVLDIGGGVRLRFLHLRSIPKALRVGKKVRVGRRLGVMGKTGAVTGIHVHLEVIASGTAIDPQPWFHRRGVTLGTSRGVGRYRVDKAKVGKSRLLARATPVTGKVLHRRKAGFTFRAIERVYAGGRWWLVTRHGRFYAADYCKEL